MAGFKNPYTPGAGHMPPYLAGRQDELAEFLRLIKQDVIYENLILTGLRGTGKTVLLETFKPRAIENGWLWVGADFSESTSISETNMAVRILTDLSIVTSSFIIHETRMRAAGFGDRATHHDVTLSYPLLVEMYDRAPGLVSDKLKHVLEIVWDILKQEQRRGIVFAYDEAQNLIDHADRNEFPLSLLLDVFQYIQRKQIPFMLVLTGLPTLFPKLVEARTYTERMFRVVMLDKLNREESHKAITEPIRGDKCPVTFAPESVKTIQDVSGGYPYFIQFICREVFDVFIQQSDAHRPMAVPIEAIERKMDSDFFAGRWARATDRQRQMLFVIAHLADPDVEFTVQELVDMSKTILKKGFSPSHANQMLAALADAGLVFKNRHGRYAFAVPLMGRFIRRQMSEADGK